MISHRWASAALSLGMLIQGRAQQTLDFNNLQLPDRPGIDSMDRVSLRLADALARVLENSKEITAARIDVTRAELNFKLEAAANEPRFSMTAYAERRAT